MKKLMVIFISSLILANNLYAQNKTIKGRVISDDLVPLPQAEIMINDTIKIGRTDLNGFFQIDIPVSVNKILFLFVGIEPTTIDLADTCDEAEVVMMRSGSYDFKTLKQVDKLRKKRFKQLSALHKAAFEKHIFKTDQTCYTQMFIHYYKKKQN